MWGKGGREWGVWSSAHFAAWLQGCLQLLNRRERIFQQLITGGFRWCSVCAICRTFFTISVCVPQCRKEKPLSMCFHVLRTHYEFSPWPRFHYGHLNSEGLCSVAPGISQLWYSWPSITSQTTPGTMFRWRTSTLWHTGACFFFFSFYTVCANIQKWDFVCFGIVQYTVQQWLGICFIIVFFPYGQIET